MASLFETDYSANAWPALAAVFGESCSYYRESAPGTTASGYPKSIIYVAGHTNTGDHGETVGNYSDGQSRVDTRKIKISSSDIAQPELKNDYVKIGSDYWTVEQIIDNAGGVWSLEIKRMDMFRKGNARLS